MLDLFKRTERLLNLSYILLDVRHCRYNVPNLASICFAIALWFGFSISEVPLGSSDETRMETHSSGTYSFSVNLNTPL
jgi:hypothetical protein